VVEDFLKLVEVSHEKEERRDKIIARYKNESFDFTPILGRIILLSMLRKKPEDFEADIKNLRVILEFCGLKDVYMGTHWFFEHEYEYLDIETFKVAFNLISKQTIDFLLEDKTFKESFKYMLLINQLKFPEVEETFEKSIDKFFFEDKFFLSKFKYLIHLDPDLFTTPIIMDSFINLLQKKFTVEMFLMNENNTRTIVKILYFYLIQNLNRNLNSPELFKTLIEFIDNVATKCPKFLIENKLNQSIFELLNKIGLECKVVTSSIINYITHVITGQTRLEPNNLISISYLLKSHPEEVKELLRSFFNNVDYMLDCLSPFSLEHIFLLACESQRMELINDEKAFEVFAYIIEEVKSRRYKNKVVLIRLLDSLSPAFLEKNYSSIVDELKVISLDKIRKHFQKHCSQSS
jgi:hypothetical protein